MWGLQCRALEGLVTTSVALPACGIHCAHLGLGGLHSETPVALNAHSPGISSAWSIHCKRSFASRLPVIISQGLPTASGFGCSRFQSCILCAFRMRVHQVTAACSQFQLRPEIAPVSYHLRSLCCSCLFCSNLT